MKNKNSYYIQQLKGFVISSQKSLDFGQNAQNRLVVGVDLMGFVQTRLKEVNFSKSQQIILIEESILDNFLQNLPVPNCAALF